MPEINIKEFKGVFTNADLEDISPEHLIVLKNLRPRNGRLVKTFAYGDKITAVLANYADNFGTYIHDKFLHTDNGLTGEAYIAVFVSGASIVTVYAYDVTAGAWGLLTALTDVNSTIQDADASDVFYHKNTELVVNGNMELDASWDKYGQLVAESGFDNAGAAWILGAGWTIVSEQAQHAPASGTAALEQDISALNGYYFRLTFTIRNRTVGSVTPWIGGASGSLFDTDGDKIDNIVATNTDNLKFIPTSDFDGDIDDVTVTSVKHISSESHTGSWSYLIRTNGASEQGITQVLSGMTVGKTFIVTAWVYIVSITGEDIQLQWDGATLDTLSTTGVWTKLTAERTYVGTVGNAANLYVYQDDGVGNLSVFYADDVSVKEKPRSANPIIKDSEILRILPGNVGAPDGSNEAKGIWLGYIARKYFDEQYNPTDAFYGFPTTIKKLDLDWTVTEETYSSLASPDESGFVDGDSYYYRFSPIYDGVQEGLLSDNIARYTPSDAYSFPRLTAVITNVTDDADFNPRMTAIKVYRSHFDNDTGVRTPYKHIHTIDFLRLAEDKLNNSSGGNFYLDGVCIPAAATETFDAALTYRLTVGSVGPFAITNPQGVDTGSGHFHFDWNTTTSAYPWDTSWLLEVNDGGWSTLATNASTGAFVSGKGDSVGAHKIVSIDESTGDDSYMEGILVFTYGATLKYLIIKNNIDVSGGGNVVRVEGWSHGDTTDQSDVLWYMVSVTKGLYKIDKATNLITINFFDPMLDPGAEHPLASETSIKVNGEFARVIGGRLWQGNIVLDPGGENEEHVDWVSYSELGQLDVNPVSNVFTIPDPEGGEVTGINEIFGNPVITKRQAIVTINTKFYPNEPTQWSTLQSIHNIGNIAKLGSISVAGSLYICYYDGIYKLSPNNLAESDATPTENLLISDPIGDVYEVLTLLQKESIQSKYDPLKNEILFTLGTDVWAYSIVTGAWRQIDSDVTVTLMSTDENAQIMVYDDADKKIYSLDADDSIQISMKTKTFAISHEREEVVRYLYVTYLSASALTVNLYAENAASAVWTGTLPANSVSETVILVPRYRAKKFSLEILDSVASATDTEIESIKIEHD